MKSTKIFLIVFLLFSAIVSTNLFSQEKAVKPRITVKKLAVSDPDNIQLQVISERITGSTELVLKFMNEYEFDTSPEILSVEETDRSLLDYCNRNNIDNIVYGKTYIGSDNSFVIEMSVFSRDKEQTALTRIGRAETALDVFDAADRLTAAIIEEFSGVHIAFGKIHLSNMGAEGSFVPYIDGEPFPENSETIENLLIGKRTVEIRQTRMLGETSIFTQEVAVAENSTAEVLFYIPSLLPAESEIIEDFNKIIDKNYSKLKRKEKVIRAFNEIDTILSNTPWNISLSELRDEYRKKRTEYEANLVKLGKKEKREFIIGASAGITIPQITKFEGDDGKEGSNYDPIDEGAWNDERYFSFSFGANLQYQIYNSLYIQTEFNYKDLSFYDFESLDNYIEIIEIPVLLKLLKQFDRHRFAMYLGPAFCHVMQAGGLLDNNVSPTVFDSLDVNDSYVSMVMGLEYGIKTGRHIFSAGLRYSSMELFNYSFYDADDGRSYDNRVRATVPEIILGYGYNLGGSGNIETEENRNKWLFPAEAGFMIMLGEDEDNTEPYAGGGALRRFGENIYLGLKTVVFQEGGAPMISFAYTKDPDEIINNFSVLVFPMFDTVVGAFHYSFVFRKISLSSFIGGPLDEGIESMAVGFGAGYYF